MASGRPRKHDRDKIVSAICEQIATGALVKDACRAQGITRQSLHEWTRDGVLADLYARARSDQAHAIAEDALSIADEQALTPEAIQRNRLRVDARKWMASKIAPRLYGEKITQEISGPEGGPVQVEQQVWTFGDKTVAF